jgi:hypothetical protein
MEKPEYLLSVFRQVPDMMSTAMLSAVTEKNKRRPEKLQALELSEKPTMF